MLEIITTILGITMLSEILCYRVQKSINEDFWSYTPEEFVRIGCYFIVIVLWLIFQLLIKVVLK